MPHIFSTLTNAQVYTAYSQMQGNNPVVEPIKSVRVNGGHGMVNAKNLVTPMGVMTTVSDSDLEFLESHRLFKDHVKNGYITVRKTQAAPEKIAADMETRDESAPIVQEDFEEEAEAKPVVGKAKEKKIKQGK